MKKERESIKDKLNTDVSDLIFGTPVSANLRTEKKDVKKGRPTISKEDAVAEIFFGVPVEELYLKGDTYLPFSNTLRSDLYLKLKRLEHHKRQSMRVLLEDILEHYLATQPLADKPLPEHRVKKLKQLKSANDLYHLRKDE
jgi:hypothetical protein